MESPKVGNLRPEFPSSRVSSLGEGLWMGGIGLALAEETSSWLDSGSTWRVLMEMVFSRM